LVDRPIEPKSLLDQNFPVMLSGDYISGGKVDNVLMTNVAAIRDVVGRLLASGVDP